MFQLASHRRRWYAISIAVILPGIIALLLWGLNLGIDFTGGTLWELQFDKTITTEQVKAVLADNGYQGTVVQLSSSEGMTDNVALIRMPELKEGSPEKAVLAADFAEQVGPYTELRISTVGSSVGNQVSQRAMIAVALASIAILGYIAFAFRKTQSPFLYGVCAIIAMLHDVLVVVGVFAILGHFFDVEVDALFVTAVLTVIGFSVHDTIVVFDRIRENLAKHVSPSFEETVNYSLAQTLVRSINTSLTVTFTLLALFLFGGESTKTFVLALLIGVVSGTYSSIFNASQLLVTWEVHKENQGKGSVSTKAGATSAA